MSSTEIPEQYTSILTVEQTIIVPISTLSAMTLTYGIYIVLFGTYVYITIRNRGQKLDDTTTTMLYPGLATLLFVLSTMFIVVNFIHYISLSIIYFDTVKTRNYRSLVEFMRHYLRVPVISTLDLLLPILLNITAEWMLIHRCYTIWSFDKRVGLPLVFGSFVTNAMGMASIIMIDESYQKVSQQLYDQSLIFNFTWSVSSAVFNFILTVLTAGRIWWIHRQIRAHGIYTSDRLAQSVSRIILESGILYPLLQAIAVILDNTTDFNSFPFELFPITTLSAGIAPTLIMVRAKLGKNVETLQTEGVSDIRFGNRPGHTATTTGTQVQSHNIAFAEIAVEVRDEPKVSV